MCKAIGNYQNAQLYPIYKSDHRDSLQKGFLSGYHLLCKTIVHFYSYIVTAFGTWRRGLSSFVHEYAIEAHIVLLQNQQIRVSRVTGR
jgi:hypothetical protein